MKILSQKMNWLAIIYTFTILLTVECNFENHHRQCTFNSLCTCSHNGPDLGSVTCQNVPFTSIPQDVNNSAIYILALISNKLMYLENNCLAGTGLWKLQINNNLLSDLPANVFTGLEKTLKVLDLTGNDLVQIPKEATRNLEKLQNLKLARNHISIVHADDLQDLSNSLQSLDLSQNALISIHRDAFRNMASLETLNLESNALTSIDDFLFYKGLHNLRSINLMENQLQEIPFTALINLNNIKIINLNGNFISSISENREIQKKITLEEMHLEHNLIEKLTQESFKIFTNINRLYLRGNSLGSINVTLFEANLTEIHMPQCSISTISKNAFLGVADTLQVLDLSDNNLVDFPHMPLKKLVKLSLARNKISKMHTSEFESIKDTLKYLDISGLKMGFPEGPTELHLHNIRELKFNCDYGTISTLHFNFIGQSIEKLVLSRNKILAITNNAFYHLSGLKLLDLSYNSISSIGNETFRDVGHSLEKLILHDSLKLSALPLKSLHYLAKLQYLDISSNSLSHLQHETFFMFSNIKYLNLNHNKLKSLKPNTFNEKKNPNIQHLKVAFNQLKVLQSHSFKDLRKLLRLELNDNLIKSIQKAAFLDLDSILSINLEGNSIAVIENESFQNLPSIQFINLSYNNISYFNLEAFDQVGRLSTMKIDLNHNKISNLTRNHTATQVSNNIKILNISHNHIECIDEYYFDSIRHSIRILDLSYNRIESLTNHAFSDIRQLETLILSYNEIQVLDKNEFDGLKKLQILQLTHNNITNLDRKTFKNNRNLRILSVSNNNFETLHDELFSSTALEYLDLSFNKLEEFPEQTLIRISATLKHLNVNGNEIQFLNFSTLHTLINLKHLSISDNRMSIISFDEGFQLSKLISLDLSHNQFEGLQRDFFYFLPRDLKNLNVANINFTSMPELNAPKLIQLNLSYNSIECILPENFVNLNKIQILDFSNNLLSNINEQGWSTLHELRKLNLRGNPIQNISSSTFNNMEKLEELVIANLELNNIQKDILGKLRALRKIEFDFGNKDKALNLSEMLSNNRGIKSMHLHIDSTYLDGMLHGNLPKSLTSLILEGENLSHVEETVLADIKNKAFSFDIRNSRVQWLSTKLFENMKEAKNFSASLKHNKLQTVEKLLGSSEEEEVLMQNLKRLELAGNELHCTCELLWIWQWLKEYEHYNKCEEVSCDEIILRDLRESHCKNMNNHSIIDVFKEDLHCISSGSVRFQSFMTHLLVIIFGVKFML